MLTGYTGKILSDTDALDPDNLMTFMLAVPTGAPISGQSRMAINALSPSVKGVGDSRCGGFFPAELKFAGFDGIVVRGRASSPVYLWIHNGQAELRSAQHLWGKTTNQTIEALKAELEDPRLELMAIGPAGEMQSRLAAIISIGNRASGRTGMGAVMGSKQLKATILKENDTCYACSVRCKRVVETECLNQPVEAVHGGPEYETISTLGSYCGVSDLRAISYANSICNDYGLDTIGTGATIAWAMECFENGLLTEAEVGFPLRFGLAEAMTRLVIQIAARQGFGALLADSSQRAADMVNKGQEYLITVKGGEAPAHMPQAKRSLALIYAVNCFGPDHQSHEHDPAVEEGAAPLCLERLAQLCFDHTLAHQSLDEEKIDYARKTQIFYSFLDTAVLCQFVWGPAWHLYGPQETVELMRSVTGWMDFSLAELMMVGERRLNMLRLVNARLGLGSAEDTLPAKFFRPLQGTGPTAGIALDPAFLEAAKRAYYRQCGWDEVTGVPGAAKLIELSLA